MSEALSRLDQLERRLGGVSAASDRVQTSFDRFNQAARPVAQLDAAGQRMQRTLELMTRSTRNTNEGLRQLEGRMQSIVDKTDRSSSAFQVASTNLSRLRQEMRGAADDAQRSVSGMQGLQGVLAAIGAGAVVNSFRRAGVEAAGAERRLGFLTKEYGEYEQAIKGVERIQKELNVTQTEAKSGIANLYAALRPTGVELKDIETAFVGFNKAARRTGATTAEISAAMLQLKQALGSGVLQGDELRSIREQAPAVGQAIAAVMGTTVGGLKKLGEQGKITTDVVLEALGDLAEGTMPPLTAVDRLGVAWSDLQAEIAGSVGPLTSGVVGFAASILEAFNSLPDPVRDAGIAIGGLTLAATGALLGLAALPTILATLKGGFVVLTGAAASAWAAVLGPIALIAGGIALLIKAAYDLSEPFKEFVDDIGPMLSVIWNDATYAVKQFWAAIQPVGSDLFNGTKQLISDIVGGFAELVTWWNSLPAPLRWLIAPGFEATRAIGRAIGATPTMQYLKDVRERARAAREAAKAEQDAAKPKAPLTAVDPNAQKLLEAQEKAAKQTRDLFERTMERGADLYESTTERVASLRESTIERARQLEQQIAGERLQVEREIADLRTQAELRGRLRALDAQSGATAIEQQVIEDRKALLAAEYDMNQRILEINRSEEDRQREAALKLEGVKSDTAKAIGKLQGDYAKAIGKLQVDYAKGIAKIEEDYALQTAKILETGAGNAGKILERSGEVVAQKIQNAATFSASAFAGLPSATGVSQNIGEIMAQGYTPEARALLKTIRFAEGTPDPMGYNRHFGGSHTMDLSRHPDKVIRKNGYASAAFGAYQFMPNTWAMLGGGRMDPARQDAGAISLIRRRGVNPDGAFTPGVAAQLSPEWASFPTLSGRSFYGQPVKSYRELKAYYDRQLAIERQRTPRIGPPAPGANALGTPIGAVIGPQNTVPAAAGGAAPAAVNVPPAQLTPLPARLQPTFRTPSFAVDVDSILAPVVAKQADLADLYNERNQVRSQDAAAAFLESREGVFRSATGDIDKALAAGQKQYELEEKRLGLLRDGVNPALAEQFIQIDETMAMEKARLSALNETLRADIARLQAREELLPYESQLLKQLQEQLAVSEAREASAGRLTAELRNQAVLQSQQKSNPANIVTQAGAAARVELESMSNLGNVAVETAGLISSSFGDAFRGIVTGSQTAQEAMSGLFTSIGQGFIDMATQMLAKWLEVQLLGAAQGAMAPAGGASGGLLGGLSGIFGLGMSLIPGLGGAAAAAPSFAGGLSGMSGFNPLSFAMPSLIPGFADGGDPPTDRPSFVGERGMELFMPKQAGTIHSNDELARAMDRATRRGDRPEGGLNLNFSFQTTRFMEREWVDREQLEEAMARAEKRGAERGEARTIDRLRHSPRTRRSLGIG